ncbi:hypothetical protein ALC53_14215 [Atta colombica]|uniref:Uncharacterized protein n=1 Tax=Atta colombica TaxID=520822 RepID=A0A195AU60_9HYME|nr:hypothetical protein ALC53_14215 [Atta colombica]
MLPSPASSSAPATLPALTRLALTSNREIRAACPRICGSASRSSGYTSSPLTGTGDLVDVHWNCMVSR